MLDELQTDHHFQLKDIAERTGTSPGFRSGSPSMRTGLKKLLDCAPNVCLDREVLAQHEEQCQEDDRPTYYRRN